MKTIIKSFEQGCKELGIDPTILPSVTGLPELKAKAITADYQLSIMRDAQNKKDNFIPDFSNSGQRKYYCWLRYNPSVGAFVFSYTGCADTGTTLGSRFCFVDANTAEKFWKTHIALFNDIMCDI